jgi:hypothetical protein
VASKRVLLAISLGLVLVVGTLVVVLSESKQRLADSNAQVRISGNDVALRGGDRNCQPDEIPRGAAQIRVFTGVRRGTGGPLDVVIKQGDRRIARGTFAQVEDGLPATADLTPSTSEDVTHGEVCLVNRGEAPIRLAGDRTPFPYSGANPYGILQDDEPRVDFLRAGNESWWSIAGVVAERFGLVKTSFFGAWTMWAVFAIIAATWIAALVLLLRRTPET